MGCLPGTSNDHQIQVDFSVLGGGPVRSSFGGAFTEFTCLVRALDIRRILSMLDFSVHI